MYFLLSEVLTDFTAQDSYTFDSRDVPDSDFAG